MSTYSKWRMTDTATHLYCYALNLNRCAMYYMNIKRNKRWITWRPHGEPAAEVLMHCHAVEPEYSFVIDAQKLNLFNSDEWSCLIPHSYKKKSVALEGISYDRPWKERNPGKILGSAGNCHAFYFPSDEKSLFIKPTASQSSWHNNSSENGTRSCRWTFL